MSLREIYQRETPPSLEAERIENHNLSHALLELLQHGELQNALAAQPDFRRQGSKTRIGSWENKPVFIESRGLYVDTEKVTDRTYAQKEGWLEFLARAIARNIAGNKKIMAEISDISLKDNLDAIVEHVAVQEAVRRERRLQY